MLPSNTELEYFIEVANAGNLTRASERLGVTQPTLSLAIKRLEDTIGRQVLIRGKSGVQVTKAGKLLLSRARYLLDEWDKLKSEVQKEETILKGSYIIGCHPSVAIYAAPKFTTELFKKYPDLELKLEHGLSRKITEKVISFEIDFGIVVNPVNHPDLVIKKLCDDEVTFWKRANPTKFQTPDSGEGVLALDPSLSQSQWLLKSLKKSKLNFKRQITSSSLETIASLVDAGSAVGLLPGRVAKNRKDFKLTLLDSKYPSFKDTHCLVYRADAQNYTSARLLANDLQRLIK